MCVRSKVQVQGATGTPHGPTVGLTVNTRSRRRRSRSARRRRSPTTMSLRDVLGPKRTEELLDELHVFMEQMKTLGLKELRPWE